MSDWILSKICNSTVEISLTALITSHFSFTRLATLQLLKRISSGIKFSLRAPCIEYTSQNVLYTSKQEHSQQTHGVQTTRYHTKIYDKRYDFDFEIVNYQFLDGNVPRSTSYGVYISQLIRFARASSYVADFNTRNKLLPQKLLKQGYRYHKLCKTFSKFYRRYYDLISKFQVRLKSLLPDFYCALVIN